MGRMVKRLSGLEIDEVSLVDVPANQHGTVVISKNHQEEEMPDLFDAQGNPVDESELEVGDFVYDEAGTEYQLRDDVSGGDDEPEYEDEYEDEPQLVGKAVIPSGPLAQGGSRAGFTARAYGARAGEFARKNKKGLIAGGAAGAAGGGALGYAGGRVGKSAGANFLSEISKALTEEERDAVIAKALDGFSEVSKRNAELEDLVNDLVAEREYEGFAEVAKGYGLGAEDALGGLMQRASHHLPQEDLQLLDRILTGAGEMSKALYREEGVAGGYGSSVLDQVMGLTGDVVAKSDLGLTESAAMTAIFDANPDAYEEYLTETTPIQYGN